MEGLKILNKPQKIYITFGVIFSLLLIFGMFTMIFFYNQFDNKQFFEKNESLAIQLIIGWCILSYSIYWLNSLVLEYIWVHYSKKISYSDLTLELLDIDVALLNIKLK